MGSFKNLLVDVFLYSHHLSAWYCIDIVRRKYVLVAHGSLRVNQDQSNQNGWEEQREKNHKVPLGFQNINMLLKDLEKRKLKKLGWLKVCIWLVVKAVFLTFSWQLIVLCIIWPQCRQAKWRTINQQNKCFWWNWLQYGKFGKRVDH